ncbi:hypothetical protein AHF37_02406, partial [Paragonimus kellicotti]
IHKIRLNERWLRAAVFQHCLVKVLDIWKDKITLSRFGPRLHFDRMNLAKKNQKLADHDIHSDVEIEIRELLEKHMDTRYPFHVEGETIELGDSIEILAEPSMMQASTTAQSTTTNDVRKSGTSEQNTTEQSPHPDTDHRNPNTASTSKLQPGTLSRRAATYHKKYSDCSWKCYLQVVSQNFSLIRL